MPIRRALISVYDKTGLIDLASGLAGLGIELISTGKTAAFLAEHKIAAISVSDVTGFPEIMDGRLKTLHPRILGGILGLRDLHRVDAEKHQLPFIDLVVCNLYPFEQAMQNNPHDHGLIMENIDVGGPTMIRAAAKNYAWVIPVVDPKDYGRILQTLQQGQEFSQAERKSLAAKAFAHTSYYDSLIHGYLNEDEFPEVNTVGLKRITKLRYGENPGQAACLYEVASSSAMASQPSLTQVQQLQGKPLSYTNLLDVEAAKNCLQEFSKPACVIIKHATVCAASEKDTLMDAFKSAFAGDQRSAFGGIVALNRPVDEELAQLLREPFFELILAPEFSRAAVEILSHKQNLRLLVSPMSSSRPRLTGQFIAGGVLLQESDINPLRTIDLTIPTQKKPTVEEIEEGLFAWKIVTHMKSNAIAITRNHETVGLGGGQVSRIDAVEMAIKKMANSLDREGCVLASDGFFPFRDSIEVIAKAGIGVVMEPGGSVRDSDVIEACDDHGIALIFTHQRCFRH